MGLRDWFRGKPEADPILGGLGQQPTGLEVEASASTGFDPAEFSRQLQAAGGDPDELVARLREMFPDAQFSVSESSIDASSNPGLAAQLFGSPAIGQADPVAALERLAALHASGALSDEEFAAAKARLLGT